MKKLSIFLIISLFGLNWACTDVVDIETDESTRSLNVYGLISDTTGVAVTLTLTTSYFDQGVNPPINDASVFLFEDGVSVGQLNPTGAEGKYVLDYKGILGKSYHVEIVVPDSYDLPVNWASTPELLTRVFQPDSFSYQYLDRTTNPSVFEEGFYSLLYFTEPSGVGDNYRIRRWLNDSLFTQDFFIFSDEFFDGATFGGPFPGITIYGPLETGDTMNVEISSISDSYFSYLSLIIEQVFQIGGPFDPPPSPIVGNIYNMDDPKEYGYGYFFTSAQSFDETVIEP